MDKATKTLTTVTDHEIANAIIGDIRGGRYRGVPIIKNIKRSKLQSKIANTIEMHDRYKGAYHWNSNASSRRKNERMFQTNHPGYRFICALGLVEVEPSYSESCSNCYYNLSIHLNGDKKNISLLKKLIK